MLQSWLLTLVLAKPLYAWTMCDKYQSYYAAPYTYLNNAWNEDDSGQICTYLYKKPYLHNNSFYSLWNWNTTPATVRAFPSVELASSALPIQLSKLYEVEVSSKWSLALSTPSGKKPTSGTGISSALSAEGAQADIVIDMFLDLNATKSKQSQKQAYEVMIWFGKIGKNALPIGYSSGSLATVKYSGHTFTLYTGSNGQGQTVYTWLAGATIGSISMDVAPLVQYLVQSKRLSSNLYLGVLQFGCETLYSTKQLNFSVTSYNASVLSTTSKRSLPVVLPVDA